MIGIFDMLPKPYDCKDIYKIKPDGSFGTIYMPSPKYTWEVKIGGPTGLTIRIEEGKEPNVFHRVMQELVLGITWRRI